MWPGRTPRAVHNVPDGTSSTSLIVENHGANVHWMEPRDLTLDQMPLTLNDSQGISSVYGTPGVVFADGSTRILATDLSAVSLESMLIVDDGNIVSDDLRGRPIIVGKDRPPVNQ